MAVAEVAGIVYDPLRDAWRVDPDLDVNYLLFATKPADT
jgi:2-polyprenyl-3-methyl-5-hydroxy-6-metoxy-1,4-benzoquinol methylase